MALEKFTKDYELLVRFNESSKIGAQLQTITVVIDDGEIISSKLDPAQPISLEQLQARVAIMSEEDWYVPEVEA